jgi:uncharacterized membrane protein
MASFLNTVYVSEVIKTRDECVTLVLLIMVSCLVVSCSLQYGDAESGSCL